MIKSDEYKLTVAGERLFKTLIDPEHLGQNVSEICSIADVSRPTYYKLMKDEEFTTLVSDTAKALVMSRMGEVVAASFKYAMEERGHSDRKMLLTMAGMYSDKQETTVTGSLNIGDKADLIQEYLQKDNDVFNKYLSEK